MTTQEIRRNVPGGFTAELLAGEPTVIKLSGELDVVSAPQLQACVGLLGPASTQNVLLDLDELTFCDSSGISALIRVCQQIRQAGGSCAVSVPHRNVRQVFKMTGVLDFLTDNVRHHEDVLP